MRPTILLFRRSSTMTPLSLPLWSNNNSGTMFPALFRQEGLAQNVIILPINLMLCLIFQFCTTVPTYMTSLAIVSHLLFVCRWLAGSWWCDQYHYLISQSEYFWHSTSGRLLIKQMFQSSQTLGRRRGFCTAQTSATLLIFFFSFYLLTKKSSGCVPRCVETPSM